MSSLKITEIYCKWVKSICSQEDNREDLLGET